MKQLIFLIPCLLISSTLVASADEQIRSAQSALKDAGFYYGPITGEISPDTTAAIRRFQIRNGLQVTGQLNQETLDSLSGAQTPVPPSSPIPTPVPVVPPANNEVYSTPSPRQAPLAPAAPTASVPARIPQQPSERPGLNRALVPFPVLFLKTPYERAPQPVQRETFIRVQNKLGDKGFYDGPADGLPTEEIRRAIASYQQSRGIRPSGVLDVPTLHEMRLLPGESGSPFGTVPSRPQQRIYRGIEVR